MGNFSEILLSFNILSTTELLMLLIVLPIFVGLIYILLRREFSPIFANGILVFIVFVGSSLLYNEYKIRDDLLNQDADELARKASNLWREKSYYASFETLEVSNKIAYLKGNELRLIQNYSTMARQYFFQKKYEQALEYALRAKELIETSDFYDSYPKNDPKLINYPTNKYLDSVYNLEIIGDVYVELDKFELAKNYYGQYLKLVKKGNYSPDEANYYYNIGKLEHHRRNFDMGRIYYHTAIRILKDHLINVKDHTIEWDLVDYYLALGRLEAQDDNFEIAYDYILRATKANDDWGAFKPRIAAIKMAHRLSKFDDAHVFVLDVFERYLSMGHKNENEPYVLAVAEYEVNVGHLNEARQIYSMLRDNYSFSIDYNKVLLADLNAGLFNNKVDVQQNINATLDSIKHLTGKVIEVDRKLEEIRKFFFNRAQSAFKKSKQAYDKSIQAENDGYLELSLENALSAIKFLHETGNVKFRSKYHYQAASILNKLSRYEEAHDHALRSIEDNESSNIPVSVLSKGNDIAAIYAELFRAQLGTGKLDGAMKSIQQLFEIANSRDYGSQPNREMIEYYKGLALYYKTNDEPLRALNYYDDAVAYITKKAEENNISLPRDIYPDVTIAGNVFERSMIELILFKNELDEK